MTINYIVDETNQDFLDANTAPNVAYWVDGANAYTNEAHLNYINTVGGFGLDVAAFIATLQALTENVTIFSDPVNNTSANYFTYIENTTQLKTSSTDYTYLQLDVDLPIDGMYLINYGINLRYEKRGSQYVKYKVDVDNSIYVSCPANNGWVEPEVWNNESNSYKGLDWSNSRPVFLTEGSHSIRLKIGRTSSKKAIANYGFLSIEEK